MPGEFRIIEDYFRREVSAEGLLLGIGDDGAVLRPRAGLDQVVVTDTLVAGRHFPAGFPAADTGWRALAVNLSDIAAMGAAPRFAFLNLTLPEPETRWLREFAGGFFELAQMTETVLAGGDTTQGPLSITVTVIGEVPAGGALTRAGARPGNLVCVSGKPGEAAAGLELLLQDSRDSSTLAGRFRRPEPRLALGLQLRDVATAVIDVSDGLIADLGHILAASGTGARIDVERLPVSAALAAHAGRPVDYVLAGGDDYELCFCISPERIDTLNALKNVCEVTVIGEILAAPGLAIMRDGTPYKPARKGWEHFSTESRE
ncbi:MAG TPA: thiamine-phosphate kinase [Gammaproteobacteria bacterium]